MEGGRQAELRQGCRQRPGREGGSAQAGMQRMPGEGCGQCPGGKEAAPREGGRECPERAAGIQQRHRLLPGLWGGADGKRPSHVPPAVCWAQRRHPFPPRRPAASVLSCPPRTSPPGQTPSGEAGRTPPGESFPPPTPLLAVLLGTSLHLLLRQPPARGQGWGFLCARGGAPRARAGCRPHQRRDISVAASAFLGHPARSIYLRAGQREDAGCTSGNMVRAPGTRC